MRGAERPRRQTTGSERLREKDKGEILLARGVALENARGLTRSGRWHTIRKLSGEGLPASEGRGSSYRISRGRQCPLRPLITEMYSHGDLAKEIDGERSTMYLMHILEQSKITLEAPTAALMQARSDSDALTAWQDIIL